MILILPNPFFLRMFLDFKYCLISFTAFSAESMILIEGYIDSRCDLINDKWVLDRINTSKFVSFKPSMTLEMVLIVWSSSFRKSPFSTISIKSDASNFVTNISWGTSDLICSSSSLLLIVPRVPRIPICFFFVSLEASFNGIETPKIGMELIDFILLNICIEGVIDATTINFGSKLDKLLTVSAIICSSSFTDFWPYGKFFLSA